MNPQVMAMIQAMMQARQGGGMPMGMMGGGSPMAGLGAGLGGGMMNGMGGGGMMMRHPAHDAPVMGPFGRPMMPGMMGGMGGGMMQGMANGLGGGMGQGMGQNIFMQPGTLADGSQIDPRMPQANPMIMQNIIDMVNRQSSMAAPTMTSGGA